LSHYPPKADAHAHVHVHVFVFTVNSTTVYWGTNCRRIVNSGYSKQVSGNNGNKFIVHI